MTYALTLETVKKNTTLDERRIFLLYLIFVMKLRGVLIVGGPDLVPQRDKRREYDPRHTLRCGYRS